ncbi:MAG TPA: hypothetical protein VGI17_17495 [Solirubrobacterales bacterium]|jgi:hypothetical protein
MATMTESSTDKRVEDLRSEMHRGFDQVDQRFERVEGEMHRGFGQVDSRFERVEGEMHRGFGQVDSRFERVETDIRELRSDMKVGFEATGARFDSLQRMMIWFFAGTLASIIAAVIAGVILHS